MSADFSNKNPTAVRAVQQVFAMPT